MKFLNVFIGIFFKERFGFFDVFSMFFLVYLSGIYENPLLLLLMLPIGAFSASMTIYSRNREETNA